MVSLITISRDKCPVFGGAAEAAQPRVLLTQLYLFGDQQPVRVLDGRALVQQQGLELPLLNVIESVKHNSQKLRRQEKKKKVLF